MYICQVCILIYILLFHLFRNAKKNYTAQFNFIGSIVNTAVTTIKGPEVQNILADSNTFIQLVATQSDPDLLQKVSNSMNVIFLQYFNVK